MKGRGRPPATRQRVLNYWSKHGPCPVAQVVRATGACRSHVQRILRRSQAQFFALSGSAMNDMAFNGRPAFGNGTSDALEVRQAIRLMCSYCADDAKIANYHHVSTETVAQVRASIAAAKRKGPERIDRSSNTPDADVQNPFVSEKRMEEMIKRGSAMLRDALLDALAARAA